MKKSLNNKSLSLLSTATWRVFGKSIYKGKQMRSKNWEVKNEESNSNNNLHKIKYRYDTASFFNRKAVHMHTKSYRGCHSCGGRNPEKERTGFRIKCGMTA
jgi:IS1 family transposase